MARSREKPSTKARREGYAELHKLRRMLCRLLFPKSFHRDADEEHWFDEEFNKIGWKDFMIRHTPALKRGGPDQPSKRRKSKRADRKSTIR